MKKNVWIKTICVLLAVVFLLGALVACNGEEPPAPPNGPSGPSNPPAVMTDAEKAYALYATATAAILNADSVTQDSEVSMEMMLYGMEMEVTGEAVSCIANRKNDSLSYYSQMDISATVTYGGDSSTMNELSVEGFQNGRMFVRNTAIQDGVTTQDQKLVSFLSAADYRTYMNWLGDNIVVTAATCGKAVYSAQQDGSAELTFSKFTKDALRVSDLGIGSLSALYGDAFELVDMIYTVHISADGTLTREQMNFVLDCTEDDDSDSYCLIFAESNYSKVNATLPHEAVSLTGYKEVDDLRVVGALSEMLTDFVNADAGEFSMHSDVSVVIAGYTNATEVVQTGTFAKRNGKYGFEIMVDRDGELSTVSYANGTLFANGEETEGSEDVARYTIRSVIDPAQITMSDVVEIESVMQTSSQSIYRLTLNDVSQAEEWVASVNGTLTGATVTATLTFSNGKLARYDYVCEATASTMYGEMLVFVETYVVYDM